jgi:hypothetical protein
VYVDEIHDGMLALLSQVRYFSQVLNTIHCIQADLLLMSRIREVVATVI